MNDRSGFCFRFGFEALFADCAFEDSLDYSVFGDVFEGMAEDLAFYGSFLFLGVVVRT